MNLSSKFPHFHSCVFVYVYIYIYIYIYILIKTCHRLIALYNPQRTKNKTVRYTFKSVQKFRLHFLRNK